MIRIARVEKRAKGWLIEEGIPLVNDAGFDYDRLGFHG